MRLVNNSIYLKIPSFEDLRYTEMLLGDKKTMSFNEKWGGTVPFPKEKWEFFYQNYITDTEKQYFHIYNLDGIFVGEVSSRYNDSFSSYVLNIKIMHRFRGNKHAFDALEAFLEYMFNNIDIERIVDNVGHDSVAGISLLRRFGFVEIGQTEEYILLELKKVDF